MMPQHHGEEDGMDREQFWALIEAAKMATGGDCRAQSAQLGAALRQGPVDEVLDWDRMNSARFLGQISCQLIMPPLLLVLPDRPPWGSGGRVAGSATRCCSGRRSRPRLAVAGRWCRAARPTSTAP